MKYKVNENCIACGLCEATCPDVFQLGEDGFAHAIDSEVDPANLDDANTAMENCPVSAIEEDN